MGFNSVLMILNDAYDVIDKDPIGWWAKAKHELTTLRGDSPKSFGFGNHCNPTEAVVCHHADVTSLIAVGGNHSTVLCSIHNGGKHHEKEDQVELLKAAAEKLGYRLTRKP